VKKLLLLTGLIFMGTLFARSLDQVPYNQVHHIMTHNATSLRNEATWLGDALRAAVAALPFSSAIKEQINNIIQATTIQDPNIVADQDRGIDLQFADGVRGFKLPVHWRDLSSKSTFYVCHTMAQSELEKIYLDIDTKLKVIITSDTVRRWLLKPFEIFCKDPCLLDRTNVALGKTLKQLNAWLDVHPQEVITIYIDTQLTSAQEQQHMNDLKNILQQVGIVDKMYVHTPGQVWPTTASMVQMHKRVVIVANSDNWKSIGILHKRDIGFGPIWSYKTEQELLQDTNNPHVDWGVASPQGLFMLDSYVTPRLSGTIHDAKVVNSYTVLKQRIQQYERFAGSVATFVMVDFYEYPDKDVFKVIDELNQSA
jgi:hypothetical protein